MCLRKKNKKSPLLTDREARIYHLRTYFVSGSANPMELHEATGVNLDLCIEFMSHCMGACVCGKFPRIRKTKPVNRK
jgi:hypothetical protein